MRAMWTGTITFGLVSIPVSIYTATDRESGPELNFVHARCASKVSVRYTCAECGGLFEQNELSKGHRHDAGMVTLSAEELAELDGAKCRTAEVLSFVDPADVPAELHGSLYYVAPEAPRRKGKNGAQPAPVTRSYQLLVETLRRSGLVALVSVSLRNREHQAVLAVSGDVLTLRVLLWSAQVREPVFDGWSAHGGRWPAEELSGAELDAAENLVYALVDKFDPAAHTDIYAARLAELIERRATELAPVAVVPDNVTPLFAELDRAMSSAGA